MFFFLSRGFFLQLLEGRLLFSAGLDKTVRQWGLAAASPLNQFVGPTDAVTSISLSADGNSLFAGSADKNVYCWKVATELQPAPVAAMQVLAASAAVRTVSASRDGNLLVTAGDDQKITLWDARSGLLLQQLVGHTEAILGVSIAADGKKTMSSFKPPVHCKLHTFAYGGFWLGICVVFCCGQSVRPKASCPLLFAIYS